MPTHLSLFAGGPETRTRPGHVLEATVLASYEALALAWINGVRAAEGRAPLNRIPADVPQPDEARTESCPIARALDNGSRVAPWSWCHHGTEDGDLLPEYVTRLIRHYDATRTA